MAKKSKPSTLDTLSAATLKAVTALCGLSLNDSLPAHLQQKALSAAKQLNAAHDAHFHPRSEVLPNAKAERAARKLTTRKEGKRK